MLSHSISTSPSRAANPIDFAILGLQWPTATEPAQHEVTGDERQSWWPAEERFSVVNSAAELLSSASTRRNDSDVVSKIDQIFDSEGAHDVADLRWDIRWGLFA